MSAQGYKQLVKIPKRILDREVIISGDYVVIQPRPKGERYVAEVALVIDQEYENFYRDACIWPKEFDIPNYVERLAEKRNRAKLTEEEEEQYKKLCVPPTKPKKLKKEKKKEDKCKTSKKFDEECLKSAPLFADDFLPLQYYDDEPWRKNLASCATDTLKNTNCGTNTGLAKSCASSGYSSSASGCFSKSSCAAKKHCCSQPAKPIKCSNNTVQQETANCSNSACNNSGYSKPSGCCAKSCCGGNIQTRDVGIGYLYTDVVARRLVISCPNYMVNVHRGGSSNRKKRFVLIVHAA